MKGTQGTWGIARLSPIMAAIAISVGLAACGGGSSSTDGGGSTTADPGITKAELIKQGDAICTATDKKQDAALKAYEKKHPNQLPDTATIEKTIKVVALPPIQAEIEELAALGAPAGEQLRVNQIIDGFEKAVKVATAKPGVLNEEGEGPFTAPDKLAAAYGFKACAQAL